NIFSNEIKCHEESLDQNCIRDYIDSFLIEMKDRQKENNVSSFTYSMLNGNVQALFGAGSGTVRITIEWCLLTMAAYTTEDTSVQGYNIPKGTFVLTNIWAVHHDHRYWKNPDTFFPEHFLSQDGTTMKKPEYFIPFSIGKRSCPGETLGLIEVFLYFTSILQRFTVALPDGEKPNFDGTCELTWEAKFHHLRLLPRN
ncbi:cytochrome P450 2U1-like, partial [Limulus polyphemus]|uniref:Cytochrome P450 2U1-like n=1 Tax=Limulus polyphemus TaxID=6850 RepID=A0ABM1RYB1_LIMPO